MAEINAAPNGIYKAITGVMADVGAVEKNGVNKQQGFKFRGIDDVMNALHPAMVKHHVFTVPEILEQTREVKITRNGVELIFSLCKIRYTFFADDGSHVEAVVIGEGMDSGDKATNKAMAIAYKYACFQVFCIPTEEMIDPDSERPEMEGDGKKPAKGGKKTVQQQAAQSQTAAQTRPAAPQGAPQQPAAQTKAQAAAAPQEPVDPDPLVTEPMITTIKNELERTGVKEIQVLKRAGCDALEKMTVTQYRRVMKSFQATPDRRTE